MCSTNIYSDSTLKIVDGVNDIGYENLLDLLQYNQCLSWNKQEIKNVIELT